MEMLTSEAERHRRSSLPLEHAMGLQQASFANTLTRLRQCGLWAWGDSGTKLRGTWSARAHRLLPRGS